MSAVDQFEWTFSPRDYFEEAIEIARDDYVMTIASGKVTGTVSSDRFDGDPSVRDLMESSLNDRFQAVQLLSHRPYELSKSSRTRLHDDGHREIYMECESACMVLTTGTVDFTVTDRHGNIISDSKRDRLQLRRSLSELISRHRGKDSLVDAMLKSYDNAVRDPQNELVHLYEIRDALSVRFGGKSATIAATGIPPADWSRLGQLCNDEPLRQGRHRGKTGGALRDATDAELSQARSIARSLLEGYLRYIDNSLTPGADDAG